MGGGVKTTKLYQHILSGEVHVSYKIYVNLEPYIYYIGVAAQGGRYDSVDEKYGNKEKHGWNTRMISGGREEER